MPLEGTLCPARSGEEGPLGGVNAYGAASRGGAAAGTRRQRSAGPPRSVCVRHPAPTHRQQGNTGVSPPELSGHFGGPAPSLWLPSLPGLGIRPPAQHPHRGSPGPTSAAAPSSEAGSSLISPSAQSDAPPSQALPLGGTLTPTLSPFPSPQVGPSVGHAEWMNGRGFALERACVL